MPFVLLVVPFLFLSLEIDTAVDNQTAHSAVSAGIEAGGQAGNLSEGTVSVNRSAGTREVRVVQDVDRIQTEFEVLCFGDLEPFDDVHIQIKESRSADRTLAESSDLSRLRVDQNRSAVAPGEVRRPSLRG